jgi:hypothetical protein
MCGGWPGDIDLDLGFLLNVQQVEVRIRNSETLRDCRLGRVHGEADQPIEELARGLLQTLRSWFPRATRMVLSASYLKDLPIDLAVLVRTCPIGITASVSTFKSGPTRQRVIFCVAPEKTWTNGQGWKQQGSDRVFCRLQCLSTVSWGRSRIISTDTIDTACERELSIACDIHAAWQKGAVTGDIDSLESRTKAFV